MTPLSIETSDIKKPHISARLFPVITSTKAPQIPYFEIYHDFGMNEQGEGNILLKNKGKFPANI